MKEDWISVVLGTTYEKGRQNLLYSHTQRVRFSDGGAKVMAIDRLSDMLGWDHSDDLEEPHEGRGS